MPRPVSRYPRRVSQRRPAGHDRQRAKSEGPALLSAWQTIYLAHDRALARCTTCSAAPAGSARFRQTGRQATSLDCASHALGDVPRVDGNDREWPADLRRVRAIRGARWTVLRQSVRRVRFPTLEPAGRLACRRTELALHPGVATHYHGHAVSLLSGRQWRVALAAVPTARHSRRDRHAKILSAPAQGASAAGQTQSAPEARLHLHYPARRAVGGDGFRGLQAHTAVMAHHAVRWLSGRALLALLGRLDLYRVPDRPRHARVRRRPGLAARDVFRMVSREVSQS